MSDYEAQLDDTDDSSKGCPTTFSSSLFFAFVVLPTLSRGSLTFLGVERVSERERLYWIAQTIEKSSVLENCDPGVCFGVPQVPRAE